MTVLLELMICYDNWKIHPQIQVDECIVFFLLSHHSSTWPYYSKTAVSWIISFIFN